MVPVEYPTYDIVYSGFTANGSLNPDFSVQNESIINVTSLSVKNETKVPSFERCEITVYSTVCCNKAIDKFGCAI